MDEERAWEKLQDQLPAARVLGVSFQDVHALDRDTNKPFIKIGTMNQLCNDGYDGSDLNTRCELCRKFGMWVTGSDAQIFEHLSEV